MRLMESGIVAAWDWAGGIEAFAMYKVHQWHLWCKEEAYRGHRFGLTVACQG
jgi:hypothetical protein